MVLTDFGINAIIYCFEDAVPSHLANQFAL